MRTLLLLFLPLLVLAPLVRAQDVTIFLLDDIGRADLDLLIADGRAPNLRRIAAGGFEFRNALAHPLCQPTRRTIDFGNFHAGWTGRPCDHDPENAVPASETSLPELVGVPSAYFGKWHEGSNPFGGPWEVTPQAHGWGLWRAGVAGGISGCGSIDYFNWMRVEDGVASFTINTFQPAVQYARWQAWKTAARGPRLSMFATPLAHAPFQRPPSAWLPAGYPNTPTDRAKYEAMIASCDVIAGKMLAGMGPNDILIVAGDNGAPGEVLGTNRAKGSTYERGINVSLLVYGGWIKPGMSDALVHVVDVYATVAELLGVPAESSKDSRSLVPLMLGSTRPVHEYVLCGLLGYENFGDDVCARSLRYKLRRVGSEHVREEFYDLQADPAELTNLIDEPAHAQRIAEHRAWLDDELGRSAAVRREAARAED